MQMSNFVRERRGQLAAAVAVSAGFHALLMAPIVAQPVIAAEPVAEVLPPSPPLDEAYPIGVEFRLNSEAYGDRYHRIKGTVTGYDNGKIQFQTNRRKSPLIVEPAHLEAVDSLKAAA